jgi:predicted RNase H-like HicB family nuclease
MTYDVLLEKIEGDGYTARVLTWPDFVVKGVTREDAITQARAAILERLSQAEIVTIEIDPAEVSHSWLPFAGTWASEAGIDEFVAEIERYRHESDTTSES